MVAACRAIREKTIPPLLAYSGLRNKELCVLKTGDVEIGSRLIHVRSGKRPKDRNASVAAPCAGPAEPLFAKLQNGNPYGRRDLRKLTHAVAKRAHIAKPVHLHLFRHSLATNMPIRGAHILAIEQQLGHTFVETMVYLHAAPIAMQPQYRLFAPRYL